jgi:hypothetical protein
MLALAGVAQLDAKATSPPSMRRFLRALVLTKSLPVFGSVTVFSDSSSALSVTA